MQTIIINLDRRPDRLAATQQQIDSVDWQSVFPLPKKFAAMDCQLIKTPIDWPYSAGAYACRLSHLAVLKMAKQTDDDVLIQEDDILLCQDFINRTKLFLQSVPTDWQIQLLGAEQIGRVWHTQKPYRKIKAAERLHAYIVRCTCIDDVIEHIQINPYIHVDTALSRWYPYHNTYGANPWLIGTRADKSDITGLNTPKSFWR